jgi:hypothetical protein
MDTTLVSVSSSGGELNNKRSKVEGTTDLDVVLENATLMEISYIRTRHNNLRCFPRCGRVHKTKSFCGTPLYVRIKSLSGRDPQQLKSVMVFGEFRNVRKPVSFAIGSPCKQQSLENSVFLFAELLEDGNDFQFVINPPRKWRYRARIAQVLDLHVFTVYVVENEVVVGTTDTPQFQVIPIWKADESMLLKPGEDEDEEDDDEEAEDNRTTKLDGSSEDEKYNQKPHARQRLSEASILSESLRRTASLPLLNTQEDLAGAYSRSVPAFAYQQFAASSLFNSPAMPNFGLPSNSGGIPSNVFSVTAMGNSTYPPNAFNVLKAMPSSMQQVPSFNQTGNGGSSPGRSQNGSFNNLSASSISTSAPTMQNRFLNNLFMNAYLTGQQMSVGTAASHPQTTQYSRIFRNDVVGRSENAGNRHGFSNNHNY